MAILENGNFVDFLKKSVEAGIRVFVEEEYEKTKKDLLERLEKSKAEAISATVIRVSKLIDFQTMGNKILIEIRNEDIKYDGKNS